MKQLGVVVLLRHNDSEFWHIRFTKTLIRLRHVKTEAKLLNNIFTRICISDWKQNLMEARTSHGTLKQDLYNLVHLDVQDLVEL